MAEAARTLEEARSAIAAACPGSARDSALWLVARSYAAACNAGLSLLRRAWFARSGGEPRAIVVYTVGIVGDHVVLLPALAALRRRYPGASIAVVANHQLWERAGAEAVLAQPALLDRLILLDADPVRRRGLAFAVDPRVADLRADLFVNLSPFGNRGLPGAVLRELIFARKAGASRAVGFRVATWSRGRAFDRVQWRLVGNEPRRPREVLAGLGLAPAEGEDLMPRDEEARERLAALIAQRGGDPASFVVLHPGAKFAAKRWPPERFAAAGDAIAASRGATLVVTGRERERPLAAAVARAARVPAVNLAGETSVTGLMELLRLAKGCVTNDTGTMHLAAMAGTPTVAIFSLRHSPTHWLPLGGRVISLFGLPSCRFCYDDECARGACLDEVGVDDVVGAFERVAGGAAG